MTVSVSHLSKVYREKRGLLATGFDVQQGELIAVVGHNGAGKSTLLKLLGGWLVPDGGEVLINGINLTNRQSVVRNIGFVPETPNLFDLFSVEYNLTLFARLFRIPLSRVTETLQELNLVPYRFSKVHTLSKGLKQRVSIGRSLISDPSLILLDEPTSGLDFEMTREIHLLLKQLHLQGKTILFSSHRPEEIKYLATRVMLIHEGAPVFDGSPNAYFESSIHQTLYA